jgi:hypothetical protein
VKRFSIAAWLIASDFVLAIGVLGEKEIRQKKKGGNQPFP